MPYLRSILRKTAKLLAEPILRSRPNLRGATIYPPGHFYSPLLDTEHLDPEAKGLPFDDSNSWEFIDLRPQEQKKYFEDLLARFPPYFPKKKQEAHRYYTENNFFPLSDAFTLSAILQEEKPKRIIEVGSGYSSAVILDTLDRSQLAVELTFIEPNPERLYSLMRPNDKKRSKILVNRIQEVPLATFQELEANDILFIDSSHVAKIGSDVSFIILRILPRLRRGVIIHFHDIFYPYSYPIKWIREGRAWNESLFLRAYLIENHRSRILAFNAYAGSVFPDVFSERLPAFLDNTGGSVWLKVQ